MTRELRCRGWTVNHKRVYRLMREDNLLCLRRRRFVVTTDSAHELPIYPNLAREMTLSRVDQLRVADITYIRLLAEFVYLAVLLDAFSRRVIGWALERTLESELTLGALRMALQRRIPGPGLVHHSDRGVQLARHPGKIAQRSEDTSLVSSFYLRQTPSRNGGHQGMSRKYALLIVEG